MKYTSDRDNYYDFSEKYLENSQSIFVLSRNDSIQRFEDLSSKRVALQQGDVAVANLNSLINVQILYTTDQEQAINKLLNNEADAYIGNTLTGVFLTNKKGIRDKVKIVGKVLNPTKYSIAVKDGDVETLKIIDKGLKDINYKIKLFQDPSDSTDETIAILRDVTEEKFMQESIRTKDKLQSLGELLASIAHEIRNPLTSI